MYLLIKIVLVVALLSLAALNKFKLVPSLEINSSQAVSRFQSSVQFEIAIVIVILTASSLLTTSMTLPMSMLNSWSAHIIVKIASCSFPLFITKTFSHLTHYRIHPIGFTLKVEIEQVFYNTICFGGRLCKKCAPVFVLKQRKTASTDALVG